MRPNTAGLPIAFGALVPWIEFPSSSARRRAPSGLPGPPGVTAGASLRATSSGVGCHAGHSALLKSPQPGEIGALAADSDAVAQRDGFRLNEVEEVLFGLSMMMVPTGWVVR